MHAVLGLNFTARYPRNKAGQYGLLVNPRLHRVRSARMERLGHV